VANILVVDDEDTVRNNLFELFAIQHTCHMAASAEQALSCLSVEQYDVVVTDYQMPGLSGLDLLANVKDSQKHTAVILISGLSNKERAKELIEMGAFDYVVKPFTLSEIEKCVNRAIAHHEALVKAEKL
jgi:DNA-binding NtrC family response regulator